MHKRRIFWKFRLVALLVFMAIGALLPRAFSSELTVSTHPQIAPDTLPDQESAIDLDLRRAYELALSRNLDIRILQYDVSRARAGLWGERGIFDPLVSSSTSSNHTESPAASQLAGADVTKSDSQQLNLSLSKLFSTGATLSLSSSLSRTETNSEFFFVNPRYEAGASLELSQPLLRGFGLRINRAGIIVAKKSTMQSTLALESELSTTLQRVEDAYWNLVAARRSVEVTEESLKLAERLLEQTRERVRVGAAAKIDTLQSEASVAARKQDLIEARNLASNAEDALKRVLGFDDPSEWELSLRTTEPLRADRVKPSLGVALEAAFEKRPELESQELSVETVEVRRAVAQDASLPELDLNASYGYGGVGGDVRIVDPDTGEVIGEAPGGADEALEQIGDGEFPQWSVGLSLSVPLPNRQRRADLAQRRLELAQEKARLNSLKQQVTLEVRRAVRAIEDGAASIDAAVAARTLAERNLEAEQVKYENGLSTNFQVLQIQEDLAEAQLAELNARVAYRKALVSYFATTGELLEHNSIEIVDSAEGSSARESSGSSEADDSDMVDGAG